MTSKFSNINGLLLINKCQGLSSNAALQQVKKLYAAKKAGHTGSLDPLATGMLPICFGETTKFCQFLLEADKAYIATGLLGIKTTTADALGDILLQKEDFVVTQTELETVLNQFQGKLLQTPPMYSALKHQGQPLYKLARNGITIPRSARAIEIKKLSLLHYENHTFKIEVVCSKGTYIRTLVEEIGEALGVYAHVTQLHRLYTGSFTEHKMYSWQDLSNFSAIELANCLLPSETIVNYLPKVSVTESMGLQLQQGKPIQIMNQPPTPLVQIYRNDNKFLGLGEISVTQILKPTRLMAIN